MKYWCNTHKREATSLDKEGDPCCDKKLGGITIQCRVQEESETRSLLRRGVEMLCYDGPEGLDEWIHEAEKHLREHN